MNDSDCLIIGGGIAGLQAAVQLGRYQHNVTVIDKGYGRSTLCRSYHNILGWPDGVSGDQLRALGRMQAERLGVRFINDEALRAVQVDSGFEVTLRSGASLRSSKLLLATGVLDRFPPLPGLEQCLGLTIYVCPDCDGYEVSGRRTIVLGSGDAGARMALTLTYWTDRIVYVNHECQPVSGDLIHKLEERQIPKIDAPIAAVQTKGEGRFTGLHLADGRTVPGERGFIAFGGNEVLSDLAQQLGVERLENRHIITNPRTMETNIRGVYAAGDVAVHAEQVTVAMGEGSLAAIWIHKALIGAG
jgi:thioredoxin reductase